MPGWATLSDEERKILKREDTALVVSAQKLGFTKMEIGQHFYNIWEALRGRKLFDAYISHRGIDRRSAYRYRKSYAAVKDALPPSMIKKAMELGFNIYGFSAESPLGEYGPAIKKLPPPQTEDPKKQEQYLLRLREEVRATRRNRTKGAVIDKNYDELVKESFRLIRPRLQRIDKRSRISALEELFGMLITSLGGKSAITVKPRPVPAGFVVPRGRPRKQAKHPSLAAA